MKTAEHRTLIISLVLLDTLTISLALALAYYLRVSSGLLLYTAPHSFGLYLRTIGMAVPIWLLICRAARLYDPRLILGGYKEYAQALKACTFAVIALIVLSFGERSAPVSRGWILLSWGLSTTLMISARFAFRRLIFWLRRHDHFVRRVLVVGVTEYAKVLVRQFHNEKGAGLQVVGFLDDYLPAGTRVMGDLEVLGSPAELEQLARETNATEVIVLPNALSWESSQAIVASAASARSGLNIQLCPSFYEILTTNVQVSHQAFVPLLTIDQVRIIGFDAVLKRTVDSVLGAILLLLSAPLIGLIGLALWFADGQPIFDRPQVLGLRGQPFRTLKFRTGLMGTTRRSLMRGLAVALDEQVHSSRLGRFLYSTGLDKLPQLFDVLRGRMSLVGPRTIGVHNDDRSNPWLPSILTVRPGMTGTWAVNHIPTLEDEQRLTVYYIRNWTLWFDLQIIFQTAMHILQLARKDVAEVDQLTLAQRDLEGNMERNKWIQSKHI